MQVIISFPEDFCMCLFLVTYRGCSLFYCIVWDSTLGIPIERYVKVVGIFFLLPPIVQQP